MAQDECDDEFLLSFFDSPPARLKRPCDGCGESLSGKKARVGHDDDDDDEKDHHDEAKNEAKTHQEAGAPTFMIVRHGYHV